MFTTLYKILFFVLIAMKNKKYRPLVLAASFILTVVLIIVFCLIQFHTHQAIFLTDGGPWPIHDN